MFADGYFNPRDQYDFFDTISRLPAGDVAAALIGGVVGLIVAVNIDWLPGVVGVAIGALLGILVLGFLFS